MAGDYRSIRTFQGQAIAAKDFRGAQWAEQRAKTLATMDVLSFLSKKAVIPKYGVPVDVVELDTSLASDERKIELDRDLSIAVAEFAPGASIVANKQLWTSYGLKRIPDREWGKGTYAICKVHGCFDPAL